MTREVVVLDDADAVAAEAELRFVELARGRVAETGRFTVVLAGGSTPARLYRRLADVSAGALPWASTRLFFGDERCVPPDHEWSNYRMVRESLLDRAPIPDSTVYRMAGELDPEAAASAYTDTIAGVLSEDPAGFDLVLLGIGDDGHTASLFPGMPALEVADRAVVATPAPEYVRPQVTRLTLTFPALNRARQVMFLATGASKAAAVARALAAGREGSPTGVVLPAGRVTGAARVTWLLDRDAAARIAGG